jgi:mRNA interferase MazF
MLIPSSINRLKQTSEVLIMHLRSISKDRFEKRIGELNDLELTQLREGIQDLLLMD